MNCKFSIALALCGVVILIGNSHAQLEVSWVGGDGSWDDKNWDDGTGVNTIDVFVGNRTWMETYCVRTR